MTSEAARLVSADWFGLFRDLNIPMPLSFVGVEVPVLLAMLAFSSLAVSPVMVDVEGEREKVLARGPRCVSLSSRGQSVSNQKFKGAMDVELLAISQPHLYCFTDMGSG